MTESREADNTIKISQSQKSHPGAGHTTRNSTSYSTNSKQTKLHPAHKAVTRSVHRHIHTHTHQQVSHSTSRGPSEAVRHRPRVTALFLRTGASDLCVCSTRVFILLQGGGIATKMPNRSRVDSTHCPPSQMKKLYPFTRPGTTH